MSADSLQVLMHPNVRYVGGEYNYEDERAFLGGKWQEIFREAIESFPGDSVAVTTLKTEEDQEPHSVDLPYGFGEFDEVVEDDVYGAVSPRKIFDWSQDYNTLVLGGGKLNECFSTFIDQALFATDDLEIRVDPEISYTKIDESPGEEILEHQKSDDKWWLWTRRDNPKASERPGKLEEFREEYSSVDRVYLDSRRKAV